MNTHHEAGLPELSEIEKAKHEVNEGPNQVAIAEFHQVHSGPIPDPATLAKYEKILPGAAERIFIMAEKQSAHRQELERIATKAGSRDSFLGIILGFSIATITNLSGVYVLFQGYTWSGTFLGSVGLAGLVSAFIYGTRSNRIERENIKRIKEE